MDKRIIRLSPHQEMELTTQTIKVLNVIGEAVGQIVVEGSISINAVKIEKITAELRKVTDHLFDGKVVKKGVVYKQITYVDPEGFVRYTTEKIPFMITVEIPGLKPNSATEVQNRLLDIDTDFTLKPSKSCSKGTLSQKVVAHVLVKVLEWTQQQVVTNIQISPNVSISKGIGCCQCKS